jgi:copper chaperone CopZ
MSFRALVCFVLTTGVMTGCASTPGKPATASTPTAPAAVRSEPLVGRSATLIVTGLACPSCAAQVDRLLRQVKGVQDVQMDIVTGVIRLTLDPAAPPTRQDVTEAVRWGGAIVIEVQQP